MAETLGQIVEGLVRKMQEPLGLDRWTIKVITGPGESTAACSADPEYKEATITVDPDRLETGDEPDEIVAHEMGHPHIWPIAAIADDLAVLAAEMLPEPFVAPMAKFFKEQARKAEEDAATQIGFTFIRLLRRLWKAEEELKALRAEVKQSRKAEALIIRPR